MSHNTLAQKRDRSNQTDSRKTKKNKRSNRTKEVKVGNPRIITGKVTDDTGEGLPGVNVVRKGTTTGVTTDFDGDYEISIVSSITTLVFSSVGMRTQQVEVKNRTIIDLGMALDITTLDEVRIQWYRGLWWRVKANIF